MRQLKEEQNTSGLSTDKDLMHGPEAYQYDHNVDKTETETTVGGVVAAIINESIDEKPGGGGRMILSMLQVDDTDEDFLINDM